MLPTRLTVWLFVFGLALVPPGVLWPTARWLLLGYEIGIFALFILDAVLAGRSYQFRVRRDRPARLSLGAENEIAVVIENPTARRMRLIARDEAPAGFPAVPPLLEGTVPAHGTLTLPYRLLPTARGDCNFGDIHLRCRGPLGLAWRDRRVTAGETVAVYPNLLETRRYEALLRATLVQAGGYRTRRRLGGGREFSHFRDYTVDDDFRSDPPSSPKIFALGKVFKIILRISLSEVVSASETRPAPTFSFTCVTFLK